MWQEATNPPTQGPGLVLLGLRTGDPECTACGNVRRVGFRDRKDLPRCKMCPDTDDRDPVTVVHELITAITPDADRDAIAEALRRTAPQRPTYRQRLVWALEENPAC